MTGLAIFIAGGIFLCNVGLVAFLVLDSRRKNGQPSPPPIQPPPLEEENADIQHEESPKTAGVGKSTLELDRFEAILAKTVKTTVEEVLPNVLGDMLGDVRLKDVEFADETDSIETIPSMEPTDEKPAQRFQPLSESATKDAFETDIRDFDDEPSAPVATGTTIDELEGAVDTAMNPDATPQQQAQAGKVLSEMQGTELLERLSQNDDIDRRVNLCIRMSIRAEFESKKSPMTMPKTVKKSVAVKIVTDDIDDFNPADLLK